MRQEVVLPQLLGLGCLRSEDSIRGALAKVDEDAATLWMDLHLNHSRERLRGPAWILDLDATVKPFNGEQEEVRSGYNRAPEWCSALVGESPTAGGIGMTG
ncbi:MAG: hypothetical protein ACK555_09380 [Acidobacteriota bacterium]|jgi:hypothetical protein